jgi:hypothetical protein
MRTSFGRVNHCPPRLASDLRTQKNMPQNKETLIVASEEAIEGVVGAWTQGMLRKKSKVDAAEEDTEEDGADASKGK